MGHPSKYRATSKCRMEALASKLNEIEFEGLVKRGNSILYEMISPAKIIWRGEILSRSPIHRKTEKFYEWLTIDKKSIEQEVICNVCTTFSRVIKPIKLKVLKLLKNTVQ